MTVIRITTTPPVQWQARQLAKPPAVVFRACAPRKPRQRKITVIVRIRRIMAS